MRTGRAGRAWAPVRLYSNAMRRGRLGRPGSGGEESDENGKGGKGGESVFAYWTP